MPKQNEKAGTLYNILKALGCKCVMKSDFEKAPIWKLCFLSREGLNIFFLKDNKIKGIFEPFISSIPRRQMNINYSTGTFGERHPCSAGSVLRASSEMVVEGSWVAIRLSQLSEWTQETKGNLRQSFLVLRLESSLIVRPGQNCLGGGPWRILGARL